MKILITGANGMLADAVKLVFKREKLICTDVEDLDITNLNKVEEFVSKSKPDVIINCAAYTAVDKAEEDFALARKINSDGPKNLAIAANKNDAILVHISTDYVFSGELPIQKSYTERDVKAPETVYGITKLIGEEAIKENTNNYYIFRTAWLYGNGNNFVRTMLKLGKEKDEITVVSDQHGSPTYTMDLADVIKQALTKKIPYGIYHVTNLGYTTWYEFAKEIFKLANIPCDVIPVTSEAYIRPAKRPKNSKLSKDKILTTGVEIPNWKTSLKGYIKLEI